MTVPVWTVEQQLVTHVHPVTRRSCTELRHFQVLSLLDVNKLDRELRAIQACALV